jgi:beta-mannosidase
MPSYRPLHDGWTVSAAGGDADMPAPVRAAPLPATVPGCVHTDLLAAGLIPDPFLDDNENTLTWIGRTDWRYETTFQRRHADTDRVDLCCQGLDTVASITLNGEPVATTENAHRSFRFDVTHLLRAGTNTLAVQFASPYRYAEDRRAELGDRPAAYPEPFNFIRKPACNFGWDWGPTLVTAGIVAPIGLHAWSTARIASVRPLTSVEDRAGVVDVHVDLDWTTAAPVELIAGVGDHQARLSVAAGQRGAVLRLRVPDVRLWWPRGHGEADRYELWVRLTDGDGTILDEWTHRIGFRTVRLDTTPDAHGTAFTLVVNDQPIFVRGVNWIPDDVFAHRMTRDRYASRLDQATAAGVNYLRVWGGGNYESGDFYELADELGLMVGQDFAFACAAYAEEEPFTSEVTAEAREQVTRLSAHPSLVMWTGNNENIWGFADWDWQEPLQGRTWGSGFYFDLLPGIVAELDPTRPYWPGSPYSGTPDLPPNDPAHGTTHIWDVWNSRDYSVYREYRPRFVAEFGFQAPPAWSTLRAAVTDEPLSETSPGVVHHQKAADGQAKLARWLAAHLPAPHNADDWHYLTQVNQARAIALAVEHFRSLRPHCMGTIVWQLNDCWPGISWSAIDYAGHEKPVWYALRRAYAERLLTIQPRAGAPTVVAVNDSPQPWRAQVAVTRLTLGGESCASIKLDISVEPGAATVLALPENLTRPERPHGEVLIADDGLQRTWWFYAEDKDLAYPPAAYEASVDAGDGVVTIRVTARSLLRDLTVYPDRVDAAARVDTALVTLLPGETVTFTVHTTASTESASWTRPPVLRCVNDVHGDHRA